MIPKLGEGQAGPSAERIVAAAIRVGPVVHTGPHHEVRRLRSDEWLRAAILELAPDRAEGWSGFTTDEYLAEMLAIFLRHRDGKA